MTPRVVAVESPSIIAFRFLSWVVKNTIAITSTAPHIITVLNPMVLKDPSDQKVRDLMAVALGAT